MINFGIGFWVEAVPRQTNSVESSMTYDTSPTAPAEIAVQPDRRLGLSIGLLTLAAVFSAWRSDVGFLLACMLSVLALGVGGAAGFRLIRPRLVIRLDGTTVHYRQGRRWSSLVRQPYVSPWFIGWRGRGLANHGVFSSQLSDEEFRRLAKTLRLGGNGLSE